MPSPYVRLGKKFELTKETNVKAQCQCGQLGIELPDTTPMVVACHCIDCQRRCGSPFGVLAYYPASQIHIRGSAKQFERSAAAGGTVATFFCPECGSTIYARVSKHPTLIGVAVGAIADPNFHPPVRSVWERSMHRWVRMPGEIEHFPQGRS
jgi:hypothetical protein